MTVPNQVFEFIRRAYHWNNGAELKTNGKTYHICNKGRGVEATLFLHPTVAELPKLAKQGFETSVGNSRYAPLAWKRVELGDIPTRPAEDWKCWDEY